MAKVKQTITYTRTITKVRKPKTKKTSNSGKKKGNPNRCPTCGRFI